MKPNLGPFTCLLVSGMEVGEILMLGETGDSAKNRFLPRLATATLATTRGRGKLAFGTENSRQHVLPGERAEWGEESGARNAPGGPTWAPPRW